MNKLIKVVATAVSVAPLSYSAIAEEEVVKEEMVEEEGSIFEAGFDFDWFSAYIDKNAVQTDRMVMQPCVWADLTYFEPFRLGFSVWQNYDLSHRRGALYQYGLNETDYNIHLGATLWQCEDDKDTNVKLEIGHDWFTYHGVRDEAKEAFPNTNELYAKLTFNNPIVGVYGSARWMYSDFGCYDQGLHYDLGLNKEFELCDHLLMEEDTLTLGIDWNVNFGDSNYLYFLFGGVSSPYYYADEESGEGVWYDDYDEAPKGGIGGTTIKLYLTWQITDYMSLGGTLAYTALINGSLREAAGDLGDDYDFVGAGADYPRDLVWGGLSLKFEF